MNYRKQTLLISLGLTLLTAAVFWQINGFDFVSYDDASYIPDNPRVRDGLSRDNIIWAFTTRHHGYWHPVTWIAHMVVCQLFGLNAGAHHTLSLLVHSANVLLLFGLLIRMTGAIGRSAFVAALFAIHPLHVESVAWIAELKDLLSTTFWILTVWTYMLFTRRERRRTYWLAVAIYAVGLMAKPMIVTLPVILLFLDFWPLERMFSVNGTTGKLLRRLILEKVPFVMLAAISSVITYLTTSLSGAVGSSDIYPVSGRLTNVVVSYATYIWKMFWPDQMACFYPFRTAEPWNVTIAAVFLATVSILVIRYGRRYRFLATGWLWYLVALLPVIGFIQAGAQSMADRYTYVSLVGIFIMISWGVPTLADHCLSLSDERQRISRVMFVLAGLAIATLSVRAGFQVSTWKDNHTLFRHATGVTKDNYLAHNNLGNALMQQGKLDEAILHFNEALRIKPNYAEAHNNLGILLADQGRLDVAVAEYNKALQIHPTFAFAQNNLGNALMQQGKLDEAILHFSEALKINPDYAEAHNNLGIALAKQDSFEQAIGQFLEALKADPGNVGRQKNLLRAIGKLKDIGKAATYYRTALDVAESANERELADVIREKLSTP